MTLGDHIRKRRLDLGLSQVELAAELGVSRTSVLSWETDQAQPKIRYTPQIIAFLGYDPLETHPESLAQELVATRRRLGLSRRKLALLLGVGERTLRSWERRESRPSGRLLSELRSFLVTHCGADGRGTETLKRTPTRASGTETQCGPQTVNHR